MKERKLYGYIFIVFGLIFGLILFLFDQWLDAYHYTFIDTWSVAILAYMIFGGIIGYLLKKVFCEQRNRVEQIKAEHKKLYNLFNSLHGLVIILDENCKVRFANHNYIMKFGHCEGKICYEVAGKKTPCDKCLIEKVFHGDLPLKEEYIFKNRIYEIIMQRFNDVDGSKLVIRSLYDITERKEAELELLRLQAEMAQLERLNLVGQMAAGIAHEIRNPMTTVRGYLQLLGSRSEFHSHSSSFELMIEELDRANSIISEFLSIVRSGPAKRKSQNINTILQHLYPLIEADTLSQNKQIVFEAGDTPDILVNSKEISQVVLNLCRNGLEAMQEGGTLTIRTYIEAGHVVLNVEDEGCGITPESIDKLGTPFFTTKDNGTGLGLSTCYSIADRNDAKINLESDSSGTAFFVRFSCFAVNQ